MNRIDLRMFKRCLPLLIAVLSLNSAGCAERPVWQVNFGGVDGWVNPLLPVHATGQPATLIAFFHPSPWQPIPNSPKPSTLQIDLATEDVIARLDAQSDADLDPALRTCVDATLEREPTFGMKRLSDDRWKQAYDDYKARIARLFPIDNDAELLITPNRIALLSKRRLVGLTTDLSVKWTVESADEFVIPDHDVSLVPEMEIFCVMAAGRVQIRSIDTGELHATQSLAGNEISDLQICGRHAVMIDNRCSDKTPYAHYPQRFLMFDGTKFLVRETGIHSLTTPATWVATDGSPRFAVGGYLVDPAKPLERRIAGSPFAAYGGYLITKGDGGTLQAYRD